MYIRSHDWVGVVLYLSGHMPACSNTNNMALVRYWCHFLVKSMSRCYTKIASKPRLSVLNFVSQLWRKLQDKIRNRKPWFDTNTKVSCSNAKHILSWPVANLLLKTTHCCPFSFQPDTLKTSFVQLPEESMASGQAPTPPRHCKGSKVKTQGPDIWF